MANNAPLGWQVAGATLNAFAAENGMPNVDLAKLLDEPVLRLLGPAYSNDNAIPVGNLALAKNFRFHARRHIIKALNWSPYVRTQLPAEVEAALKARWPEAVYTCFKQ